MVVHCQSLPLIEPINTRVLILGSMPGAISLQHQQYYAHPRNHFWPILAALLEQPLPGSYAHRIKMIEKAGIALWDVAAECEREGSSDTTINQVVVNDFASFLSSHRELQLIAFNGNKASQLWRKYVRITDPKITLVTMPSTSPALTWPMEEKLRSWSVIKEYL